MHKSIAAIGALCVVGISALHVVQILDSVILEKDEFIQLNNFNDANMMS